MLNHYDKLPGFLQISMLDFTVWNLMSDATCSLCLFFLMWLDVHVVDGLDSPSLLRIWNASFVALL